MRAAALVVRRDEDRAAGRAGQSLVIVRGKEGGTNRVSGKSSDVIVYETPVL